MLDLDLDIIYDAQSFIVWVMGTLEFLLGVSYVAGKWLTFNIVDVVLLFYHVVTAVGYYAEFCLQTVVGIVETGFLIYYAIGHIIDAFVITFADAISFVQYVWTTVAFALKSCFDLITTSITSLIILPEQVGVAITLTLSLIGDSFLSFCKFITSALLSAWINLISTPLYLFSTIKGVLYVILTLPQKLSSSITLSSYTGLAIVIIAYIVFRRFPLRQLFAASFQWSRRVLTFCHHFATSLFSSHRHRAQINASRDPGLSSNDTFKRMEPDAPRNASGICVVCFENPVTYLATPCNHICICKDCCHELVRSDNRCPLCRKTVRTYTRVYIS